MARLALTLDPGRSLEEAVARVRLAESLGYERVFATHIAAREPMQVLAHYAHATERIGLGTSIMPIQSRHPIVAAMEAATLHETSGGRFALGLGVSHRLTVEGWYGLPLDDPVGRLREYATIVRGILKQGSVSLEGTHYTARFGFLGYTPPPGVTLLFAALGPKMLRLAAELADGVTLWMCSPGYIREVVRPTLDATLAEHGRDPEGFDVIAAVPLALGEDAGAARDAFRKRAFPYLQLPFYRKAIAAGGHDDVLTAFDAALAAGGPPDAMEAIPDAFVDDYAGVGDAAMLRAKLEDYRAAGVTLPSVGPLGHHAGEAGLEATLEAAAGS